MACRRNGYWAIPPSTPTTSAPTSGPSTPRPSSPRILRGPRNCRSTNTSTRKGIWSNAASTSSSTSGAWQPVTRRLRGTSSPSSPSRLSPCGSDDCQQDLGLLHPRDGDDLAPFLGLSRLEGSKFLRRAREPHSVGRTRQRAVGLGFHGLAHQGVQLVDNGSRRASRHIGRRPGPHLEARHRLIDRRELRETLDRL